MKKLFLIIIILFFAGNAFSSGLPIFNVNYFPYSYDFVSCTNVLRLNTTDPTLISDPDGTNLGFPIIPNADNNAHIIKQTITNLEDNKTYCFSLFVKAGTPVPGDSNVIMEISLVTKANNNLFCQFNLSDGTIYDTAFEHDVSYAGIESITNGWYRCWVANDFENGLTDTNVYFNIAKENGYGAFVGDNSTPSFWVFGAQLNKGTHPIQYIQTVGNAVIAGEWTYLFWVIK